MGHRFGIRYIDMVIYHIDVGYVVTLLSVAGQKNSTRLDLTLEQVSQFHELLREYQSQQQTRDHRRALYPGEAAQTEFKSKT